MNTFVIGVSGKARHGKNSVAEKIVELLSGKARLYSFATALKAYCRVNGWMKVKDAPVLQLVGTDLMRRVDPDIWVKCLGYQIEEESPDIAVISDVRFPNELSFCDLTVRINRLNPDGTLFVAQDRPADHPSEIALDDAEFDIKASITSGHMLKVELVAGRVVDEALLRIKQRALIKSYEQHS